MYRYNYIYIYIQVLVASLSLTHQSHVISVPASDKPSPPEGPLVASDITADSAALTWKPPKSDGGSPLTGYVIEKRDVRKTTWTKVASVDAQTLTCSATKLLEGTPYLFRVMAVNKEGSSLPLESQDEVVPKKPAGEEK